MKFGSLFSGIGGIDLGLERAGMECAWQVEWNEWCRKVLNKHWPDVPQYGDITELTGAELEPVDLICGGFPCQPVSLAGKRLAQDDPRWLWPHFSKLIRVLRPRFALMENVPGLLSAGFGDVLGDLAEIGYDAEWQCIPAAAVGAPHLRYRVFIVAHANSDPIRSEQIFRTQRQGTSIVGDDGEDWDVADADNAGFGTPGSGDNREWSETDEGWEELTFPEPGGCGPAMVNTNGERLEGSEFLGKRECVISRVSDSGGEISDSNNSGLSEQWRTFSSELALASPELSSWWATEPDVGRVADGVPSRVDRLRGLGNAVVPQVAEYVGRCIMNAC